jgi:hypothetical protein
MSKQVNFMVSDEGTVVFITPISETARQWVDENLSLEPWQWLGEGFGIEHRYADEIIQAMAEELGGICQG